MLNPYYGLFQYSRDDIYTLQINQDSGINPVSKQCDLISQGNAFRFVCTCMSVRVRNSKTIVPFDLIFVHKYYARDSGARVK